jgi:hypothetical protein
VSRRRCRFCNAPLPKRQATGRPPEHCDNVCRQAEYRKRKRRTATVAWPPNFETAEDALIELRRQRLIEPEVALARIVAAWQVAA